MKKTLITLFAVFCFSATFATAKEKISFTIPKPMTALELRQATPEQKKAIRQAQKVKKAELKAKSDAKKGKSK